MTADKYLQNKSRYYEDYPRVRTFNSTSSPYEQRLRERQIRRQQRQSQRRRPVQNTLQRKKAPNLIYLDKQSKRIHSSSQNILKAMTDILGLVTLGALALLGLSKYIDAKESSFSPEYAPENVGVSSTGHYEGTDQKTIIKNKIIDEAKKQGVDPSQALAIAHWETRGKFNPDAYNNVSKAAGIFQVTPIACEDIGVDYEAMKKDIDLQIYAGVAYLKKMLGQFNGDFQLAAAAYNWGPNHVRNKGLSQAPRETKDYVREAPKLQQQYSKELSNLKPIAQEIKQTSNAGKIHRYSNGTLIGGYKMGNTVAHNGEYYIDLSERAEAYLHDVGGKGRITSGAEGSHALGNMSHASGNKIDVSAYNLSDDNEWADVAIPFLKNKNTAFVCFEDFSKIRFERIQKIIYSKIDANLKAKCDSKVKYGWGDRGGCFLDYKANFGTGLHLDIGILPNAYSKNAYKQEQKESKNNTKVEQNNQAMKNDKKPVSTQPKQTKTEQPQPTTVLQTQPERVNPTIDLNKMSKKNNGSKKGNS